MASLVRIAFAGIVFAAMGAAQFAVPRPSPDFTINLPDGKQLPLKQLRGKIVAVAFISTT